MPTLPIVKNIAPEQEKGGRQPRLSLPGMRLPVQPAEAVHAAVAQHRHGTGLFGGQFRWKSLDRGRTLVLRQAVVGPGQRNKEAQQPHDTQRGDDMQRGIRSPLLSPVAFAHDVLNVRLWDKQEEVLTALTDNRRVAVKSGNGLGKGFCAAVAVLWFMHSHPGNAITLSTAPTFRQVRHILWRQIHRLYRPVAETLGGKMLDTRWEFSDGRYAMGLSAENADQFQGFHSPSMFIVVDEAEGISEDIYEAIESVMTSADPLLLLIGNPTTMDGAFRRALYEEREIYCPITISALDSPNVRAGRVVIPGLTTSKWVEERRNVWGEKKPVYRSRVLGEFPNQGDDTLISLSDIEAAVNHIVDAVSWTIGDDTILASERRSTGDVVIAVDVARFGPDSSVILLRRDDSVEEIQALHQQDTMQLAGRVAAAIREHNPDHVLIDEIGIGAGVVDRLRELGHPVRGINVGHRARQDKVYANLRAEGYWTLAERFASGFITIPSDNELISQLATLRYRYDSQGRIKIEGKDEIRRRGLPSPDKADALMLSFLDTGKRVKLWT